MLVSPKVGESIAILEKLALLSPSWRNFATFSKSWRN
jgi:hypothetical protein